MGNHKISVDFIYGQKAENSSRRASARRSNTLSGMGNNLRTQSYDVGEFACAVVVDKHILDG